MSKKSLYHKLKEVVNYYECPNCWGDINCRVCVQNQDPVRLRQWQQIGIDILYKKLKEHGCL